MGLRKWKDGGTVKARMYERRSDKKRVKNVQNPQNNQASEQARCFKFQRSVHTLVLGPAVGVRSTYTLMR